MMNLKEIERIKNVYKKRQETISPQKYSLFNISHLFLIQHREWEMVKMLKRAGIRTLQDKKILDVGCGDGRELINLIRYGAKPENLYGIDLLEDRIIEAKKLHPYINFISGDASTLPYFNEYFDIVMQFTVFTSILDKNMKKKIAEEMIRVLKPDGIILWYDFSFNNPRNPDVKRVSKKDIYELFPNCEIYLKRIILAPPITRLIARRSQLVCYILEKLKIFNTHYIGIIKKKT
jgi:ubiquinone/menaquinone biosynthesis C-methylase UbiE